MIWVEFVESSGRIHEIEKKQKVKVRYFSSTSKYKRAFLPNIM